jgi:hypothetical protein
VPTKAFSKREGFFVSVFVKKGKNPTFGA